MGTTAKFKFRNLNKLAASLSAIVAGLPQKGATTAPGGTAPYISNAHTQTGR